VTTVTADAVDDDLDLDGGTRGRGALSVLRRGLAASPELRSGARASLGLALMSAAGKVTVPVLIQQIIDRGFGGPDGFRPGFVFGAAAVAAVVVVATGVVQAVAQRRLVRAAQQALYGLRTRAFSHIHRLSIADHNESRRGVWVSRVTSDVETLARFAEWGAVAWIIHSFLIVGVLVVMAVYSWQLTLVTIAAFAPIVPLFRWLQRRQLAAYDEQRVRVGEMLSEFSEVVGGAPVVRAYGLADRSRRRLHRRIRAQYKAEMRASKYFAFMFPLADLFGSLAVAAVVMVGVQWGPDWGLDLGQLIGVLFLANLLNSPVAELSEVLDQTQTALAGWRKVLDLLDRPVDIAEPPAGEGVVLPPGALAVRAEDVSFAYRDGATVLAGVDIEIAPGTSVAIVGETGSGKTTFARLLCRLADPTAGRIVIGGIPLALVAPVSRRSVIRMVPQDGFLFDTTVRENVRHGRPDALDHHVAAAFEELGLAWWAERLPLGLDTPVGARGEALSVGERQLVALARAELADPGLLILDEATASVDPRTERALTEALGRVSRGRTTISIAHRLSTAEAADRVLVFDRGRIVEQGHHSELVAAGGIYTRLHASWMRSHALTSAPVVERGAST